MAIQILEPSSGWPGSSPAAGSATPDWINVAAVFGARGDAKGGGLITGSTTNNSRTLTASSAVFLPSDTGKRVVVGAAGPGGTDLVSTITSITSSTVVQMADPAAGNFNPVNITYGTDNTNAFAAACASIQAGQTLYIPSGYYLLASDTIVIDKVHANILGDGFLESVLVPLPNANNSHSMVRFKTDPSLAPGFADQEITNIGIQNFALNQFPGDGITYEANSGTLVGAHVRKCYPAGMHNGLNLIQVYQARIESCVFDTATGTGIRSYKSRFVRVEGSEFFQCVEGAQFLWDGATRQFGLQVAGNLFIRTAFEAILVEGFDQAIIVGNHFDATGTGNPATYSSIDMRGCTNAMITANASSDEVGTVPTLHGISLDAATSDCYVYGNRVGVGVSGTVIDDNGTNNKGFTLGTVN